LVLLLVNRFVQQKKVLAMIKIRLLSEVFGIAQGESLEEAGSLDTELFVHQ